MSKIEDRLAALEAENMRLAGELAALRPSAPKPLSAPPEPQGARTYQHASGFAFVMPSEAELRRLHAIVLAAYPMLEQKVGRFDHPDDAFRAFTAAFVAVGRTGRTAEPVDSISTSYFVDYCDQLLGGARTVTHSAFWAAVVAHGDIAFRPFEHDGWAPGLEHRVNAGRPPAGDVWRNVLAAGQAPKPTHPVRYVPQWNMAVPQIRSW